MTRGIYRNVEKKSHITNLSDVVVYKLKVNFWLHLLSSNILLMTGSLLRCSYGLTIGNLGDRCFYFRYVELRIISNILGCVLGPNFVGFSKFFHCLKV